MRLELRPEVGRSRQLPVPLQTSVNDADHIRRAWNLDELAVARSTFVATYLPVLAELRLDCHAEVDPEEAFLLRILLIHDYRRLLIGRSGHSVAILITSHLPIVVSSQAQRLKPYAMDVRTPMDPVHWFLDGKDDVRSSYFLEDVATEFHVQGLELDWACVTWDADFRYSTTGWQHGSFVGDRWNRIHKPQRQMFQKNAYRVLLTRARQGMVIVVPPGDTKDHTRLPEFYDGTFEYLKGTGLSEI